MSIKDIVEVLHKRNHRVFVRVTTVPGIGEVIPEYIRPTGLAVISVTKNRHGIVYVLANGANITFGVNAPGKPKYYQLMVDKTKEVEKKDESKEPKRLEKGTK